MRPLTLTIANFLESDKEEFLKYLTEYIHSYELPLGEAQIEAWRDCLSFIQEQLRSIDLKFMETYLIFEYMLPLEKFRRPDVLLLFNEKIVILEFKQKLLPEEKDIEQAIGYREDIKNFHYVTSKLDLESEAFIVATKSNNDSYTARGVKVLNRKCFVSEVFKNGYSPLEKDKVDEWINSRYEPIPSIIEAANRLFYEGELPYIKNIKEGEIEDAINKVKDIVAKNEEIDKRKKIIFVSGVPGAGKTLVALKTLYDYNKERFGAVYLSGNGPLVSVLKEQLSGFQYGTGKAYIKGMIELKREYLRNNKVPNNTLLLFDEAQRAWDKKKMKKDISEAEGLLEIADKIYNHYGYVTVVCFIGDGQSIYEGEEKGLLLWEEALKKHNEYDVYVPGKYEEEFSFSKCLTVENDLFLDTSIRTNFIDTSAWIEAVLKLDEDKCIGYLDEMLKMGLVIRVARDMEKVKVFSEDFAKVHLNGSFGLLISSKAKLGEKNIKELTNGYFKGSYIKNEDAGKWYIRDCKKLGSAASEFFCQGLEIDLPIVIFGGDYYIKNGAWYLTKKMEDVNRGSYEDYGSIVENTYRVLLSRARKGMILFVPNTRGFDETYEYFRRMGIEEL